MIEKPCSVDVIAVRAVVASFTSPDRLSLHAGRDLSRHDSESGRGRYRELDS